jgi:pre-rRNA-processing protein TSR2
VLYIFKSHFNVMSTSAPSDVPKTGTTRPPAPAAVLFARGVIAVLAKWPVLKLAVDEGWGGPSSLAKRTWLASIIVDEFETRVLDQDDVEDIILQAMADEFEVEIDDGSSEMVARTIVKLWAEVSEGRDGMVLELEAQADRLKGKRVDVVVQKGNGDEDWEGESGDEEDDEMDVDEAPQLIQPTDPPPPKQEPVVDEDGFTLVQGKRKAR